MSPLTQGLNYRSACDIPYLLIVLCRKWRNRCNYRRNNFSSQKCRKIPKYAISTLIFEKNFWRHSPQAPLLAWRHYATRSPRSRADRRETLPHKRKMAEFYNASPKIGKGALTKNGAKNMQNFGRFYTTSDFDREYLWNDSSKIGPWADRRETLPHGRKLSEFYNPSPKIRGGASPKKIWGPKTCKISVDFIQPPTLIANISGTAQDI